MNTHNPIVPSSGLYLLRCSRGPVDQFCIAFRKAWQQIPLADRRIMTRYWRWARTEFDFLSMPVITSEIWLGYGIVPNSDGICCDFGMKLRFDAYSMEISSEERTIGIIGHELGHVRSYSDGDWWQVGKHGPVDREAEERAIEYAERRWGFPDVPHICRNATCGTLDRVATRYGLNGRVFVIRAVRADWQLSNRQYIYLPPGEILTCDDVDDSWIIGETGAEAKGQLEAIAYLKKSGGLAWRE